MTDPARPNLASHRHTIPCVIAVTVALSVLSVMSVLCRNMTITHREHARASALRSLAAVRGAAELAINRRVHLLVGLKAHFAVNPDMDPEEFVRLSQLIMSEVDGIRSVTSIKDNVINDVYPREGNEGAIGLDLLEHPSQRSAALRAIETGRPWLTGPVHLVQGGDAFIHRSPVYCEVDGRKRYWGMVSLLIDRNTLVNEIMASVPKDLEVAIRNRTTLGHAGDVFLGSNETLSMMPIVTEITLPTGSWELFGVCAGGWPTAPPHAAALKVVGIGCSILIGFMAFTMVSSHLRTLSYAQRLEIATAQAESSRREAEQVSYQLAVEAVELQRYAEQLESARTELATSNAALERSNRELEQFAYVASHDLQEPLRKVSSFCGLLADDLDDKLDDTGRTYMSYILDAAGRMRALIQDLLALSRVNSGEQLCEHVDANLAVQNAIRNLSLAIEETGAVVHVDDLPKIWSRPSHVTQLFQNLVSNGLKYRSSSPPNIQIRAKQVEQSWVFSVSDNGIGIAPKFHEQVFGIFKRLHRKHQYPGTGIGLAICQRIVKLWNGQLWVESEEGQGATFSFTVPMRSPSGKEAPLEEGPDSCADRPCVEDAPSYKDETNAHHHVEAVNPT